MAGLLALVGWLLAGCSAAAWPPVGLPAATEARGVSPPAALQPPPRQAEGSATPAAEARALEEGQSTPSATLAPARFSPPTVVREHTSRVTVLAWSPDGRTLAGGSRDHAVCLWRWGGG